MTEQEVYLKIKPLLEGLSISLHTQMRGVSEACVSSKSSTSRKVSAAPDCTAMVYAPAPAGMG